MQPLNKVFKKRLWLSKKSDKFNDNKYHGENAVSVKIERGEDQDPPKVLAFNLGLKDEQVLAT